MTAPRRVLPMLLLAMVGLYGFTVYRASAQLVPLSIDTLSRKADWVVRGRVLSRTCQADPAGRIYTRVVLQVNELWKGTLTGSRLTVIHGGGLLGERRVAVSSQVHYAIGEDVVAFLVRNDRGKAVTLGLVQGKFHVWRDPATGELLVRNPFHGRSGTKGPLGKEAVAGEPGPLSLAALKRQVEGALK